MSPLGLEGILLRHGCYGEFSRYRLLTLLDKISDPGVRLFFDVWHALHTKFDGTPPRAAIDPLALGRVLSKVWLYERQSDGSYISDISGEDIRSNWNVKMMGQPLSEIIPLGGHKLVEERFNYLLEKQCVIHGFNVTQTKSHSYAERLYVPLMSKGGDPICIFGVSNYNRFFPDERDRHREVVKNFEVFSYDPKTLEAQEKLVFE
ncbi:MAG: PAS domain-containing protein [Alphaproteobacteria bacterium]|nr:PAS domain-containing protein [Alphaproteobacteria bacterium]